MLYVVECHTSCCTVIEPKLDIDRILCVPILISACDNYNGAQDAREKDQ